MPHMPWSELLTCMRSQSMPHLPRAGPPQRAAGHTQTFPGRKLLHGHSPMRSQSMSHVP